MSVFEKKKLFCFSLITLHISSFSLERTRNKLFEKRGHSINSCILSFNDNGAVICTVTRTVNRMTWINRVSYIYLQFI